MTPQFIRDAIKAEIAEAKAQLAISIKDDEREENGEYFEERYTATDCLEDFVATLENLLELAR